MKKRLAAEEQQAVFLFLLHKGAVKHAERFFKVAVVNTDDDVQLVRAFPVYRGEKGVFRFVATAKARTTDILDATGGQRAAFRTRLRLRRKGEASFMKPLKEKLGITIDGDVLEKLRLRAESDDRSLSQFINLVLRDYLKRKEIAEEEK